jgi:Xaa-Pro aminopeptidase
MVFHLPLCLRLPGQWGIGMSNTVLVGEREVEPLTHNDWELTRCS